MKKGCDFNPRWFWTQRNIKSVLEQLPGLQKPVYHICSGISNIGEVRCDRSYINLPFDMKCRIDFQGSCNVKGDMEHLPFKSSVAGSVICDPPYDYDFTKTALIKELVRICRPRGKMLFIAPWIPDDKTLSVIKTELWKVGKDRSYHKIMTVFYKINGQISDY